MEKIEIVMNDFSGLNNECLNNQKLIREHKLEELRKECKSIKEEAAIKLSGIITIISPTLEVADIDSTLCKIYFNNDKFHDLIIYFDEDDEDNYKFKVQMNISACGSFDINNTTDKDENVYNYYMLIASILSNKDGIKDHLNKFFKNFYFEYKEKRTEAMQMSVDIMNIKKEFEYREKTAKDDEIWSKILDDKKLQKKFIVIKNTNKSYLQYNGNFVHFVSEPDMKKNLKPTLWKSEQIVKVSDIRMMIH